MNNRYRIFISILFSILLGGIIGCTYLSETSSKVVPRISKEELKARIDDPSLIILDVRRPKEWKKSGKKIKGAIQENPNKFASWFSRYQKTKEIVLY
jgi:predicted sulfurtransferase